MLLNAQTTTKQYLLPCFPIINMRKNNIYHKSVMKVTTPLQQ